MLSRLLGENNDVKELLFKSASFFIIKSFGFLSGYIFVLIISNLFGATVNGYVAMSFSIFLIGSIIPRLGFDINLVKMFSSKSFGEAKHYYKKSILISGLISLIMTIVGFALKRQFGSLLGIENLDYVTMGFLSIPLWTFTLINSAVLRGMKDTKWHSFLTNAGRFIFGLILLLTFYFGMDERGIAVPILSHTIGMAVLALASYILVYRRLKSIQSEKGDLETKSYIVDSAPLMFSSALILLLGWTDTIFLGVFDVASNVGIYHVVLKLVAVIGFSLQSMNSILAPKIAKSYYTGDQETFNKLLQTVVKINFYFSIGLMLVLILFRDPILLLFGEEFLGGSTLLVILCVGQLTNTICGPVGVVFQMTGQQKTFQNLILIAFLINLTLNFLLIPTYGIYGAAISSIVGMSFWNLAGVFIIQKKHDILLIYNPFK